MKRMLPALLLFCAAAFAGSDADQAQAGLKEASRLREVHARWLAERPRKFDGMDVDEAGLSSQARSTGFHGALVTGAGVLLFTTTTGEVPGTGLLFGRQAPASIANWLAFGLRLEATAIPDIFKFEWHPNLVACGPLHVGPC